MGNKNKKKQTENPEVAQAPSEDLKAKKKKKKQQTPYGPFREILDILMYGLSLLIFCKGFVWQNFQIPTSSMEHTLLIGDHITANTFMYKPASDIEKALLPYRDPKRGDVVVFKFPGDDKQDWIKRCIGLPGDTFEMKDDVVYINGKELDETYTFYKKSNNSDRDPNNRFYPMHYDTLKPGLENGIERHHVNRDMGTLLSHTKDMVGRYRAIEGDDYAEVFGRLQKASREDVLRIPEGYYLMLGDNRNNSYDSREWGLVPREFIHGKAYFVWWSYGEDTGSHEWQGWDKIKSYLRVPLEFFKRTHWDETFSLIK